MIDIVKEMTPAEMRKRAWRSLDTAEAVLRHGDSDVAAYLAGQAAELALKSRYCAANGLASLPTGRKELQKHKLNEHRLDELLELSDSIKVQRTALDSIDWARVSEWHNEDRYRPFGSVSPERAAARIEQTRRLFTALVHHEVVTALSKAESQLAAEGVVFNLFAWLQGDDGKWRVSIATHWLDDLATRESRAKRIRDAFTQLLAPDLMHQVTALEYDGVADPLPRAFYNTTSMSGGMTVRNATVFGGGHLPPPVRNNQVIVLDNIATDSGRIHRAYVIAVQPPRLT